VISAAQKSGVQFKANLHTTIQCRHVVVAKEASKGTHNRDAVQHVEFSVLTTVTEWKNCSEHNSCSAIQQIPRILKGTKVRYRDHKSLSLLPDVSHINPVQMLPQDLRFI
jgi:hypothetical protein